MHNCELCDIAELVVQCLSITDYTKCVSFEASLRQFTFRVPLPPKKISLYFSSMAANVRSIRIVSKSRRSFAIDKLFHSSIAFIHCRMQSTSCSFNVDSLSYCDGYDDALYHKMKNDTNRTSFYEKAIAKHCQNKIVLDIGCGSLALLSIIAANNNATKVYAIETNEVAYNNAKQLIQQNGLSEKISIIHGHSNDIQLPEKCDIVINEIIGEIASSEGVHAAINCIKSKYLNTEKNKIWSIPDYVQTYLAPVEFPDSAYWQSLDNKIIANDACNTINLWNYPQRHYLCSSDTFGLWEHIQFNQREDAMPDQFEMNEYEFIEWTF